MSSLFGTRAFLISDINLILQFVMLAILLASYLIVKTKRLRIHGYLMLTVVSLNLISILMVMIPAAAIILGESALRGFVPIVAVHGVMGAVVEALGIYFVGVWRFRAPMGSCIRLRNWMRLLLPLWILTTIGGVYVYYVLYVQI